MKPRTKARKLIELHTLYLGDNGAGKEFWTDKFEAKRHAMKTINEMLKIDLLKFHSDFWRQVKEELEKL